LWLLNRDKNYLINISQYGVIMCKDKIADASDYTRNDYQKLIGDMETNYCNTLSKIVYLLQDLLKKLFYIFLYIF